MERLPFDPDKVAGPPEETRAAKRDARRRRLAETKQLSVRQVCELIRTTLEDRIPSPLRVVGEISNFSGRQHWYFSLKDEEAVLSCVVWASTARRLKFTPQDGQEVVATGQISHWAPQGRTQLYVSGLTPVGAGALELRFRALCDELRQLGYFDEARKRPLPLVPRRIAVITSADGAAIQDVIVTAGKRAKAIGLVVVNVRVQGAGAAEEIADAIARVNRERDRLDLDAILVTRGGGSIEDLWAFNERVVADAVLRSELPVVAAIGHESDTTIIELVADLRAATPTQAAMLLVPSEAELCQQIVHLSHRMASILKRRIEREQDRLAAMSRLEVLRRPRATIERAARSLGDRSSALRRALRARLHEAHLRTERAAGRLEPLRPHKVASDRRERCAVLADRLDRAIHRRISERRRIDGLGRRLRIAADRFIHHEHEALDWREHQLQAIEVRRVLRRGFSYTTRADGAIVRSIADVGTGEAMTTHVADGFIRSVVGESRRRSRTGKAASDAEPRQLDLFGDAG